MVGGRGLCTTYRQVGQSINYSWTVGRNRNRVEVVSFSFGFPLLFYVKFQERHRQTPDANKGGQFICDKQIVGAEELWADRVPREVLPLVALIYSRVNRADWEDGMSFFPRN